MKRILISLILLCPVLRLLSTEVTINGIRYKLSDESNSAEVIGNINGYSGEITIPEEVEYNNKTFKVTSIGIWAFSSSYAKDLKSIILPKNLQKIGSHAFSSNTSLEKVVLNEGLKYIEKGAFEKCSNLGNPTIPNSVIQIDAFVFESCFSITSICIPGSVSVLNEGAFEYCKNLKKVIIEEGVKTIGLHCFKGCTQLSTLSLPNSLQKISEEGFMYCSSLKSVIIPNKVTRLEYAVFQQCSSLERVVIYGDLDRISSRALFGCTELKDLYCYSRSMPKATSESFDKIPYNTCKLHVPSDLLDDYKNTSPWNKFSVIVSLTQDEANVLDATIDYKIERIIGINGVHSRNAKGLYIIKYNNGEVKKIFSKGKRY